MSEMLAASSVDLAIGLAAVAGLATLLVFLGVHQLTRPEIDLGDRLAGWGDAPRSAARSSGGDRQTLTNRLDAAVAGQSFAAGIQRELARANLRLTVGEYLMLHVGAVLPGLLIGLLLRNLLIALVVGVIGFYAPRLVVRTAQRRRFRAFGSQLADTLLLMSNSLRAGYSLLQSMETVAREAPQPMAEEFGRVVREVGLGLSPEQALINLHRRLPSEDLDLMVAAINVQHEVGGNLAKIFDTLGETIRERGRIRGEIQTLTAQQRIGGNVIALLPLAMAGLLFLVNPKYLLPLFTSERVICMPAFGLPIVAIVMMVIGYVTIRRIVAIEV